MTTTTFALEISQFMVGLKSIVTKECHVVFPGGCFDQEQKPEEKRRKPCLTLFDRFGV